MREAITHEMTEAIACHHLKAVGRGEGEGVERRLERSCLGDKAPADGGGTRLSEHAQQPEGEHATVREDHASLHALSPAVEESHSNLGPGCQSSCARFRRLETARGREVDEELERERRAARRGIRRIQGLREHRTRHLEAILVDDGLHQRVPRGEAVLIGERDE